MAVFPLPGFPGRAQEGLLGQLLRKKVEPGVEDWIQEGLNAGNSMARLRSNDADVTGENLENLWDWAAGALQDELRRYLPTFGGNYTLEERKIGIQNVVTGLQRTLPDTMADSSDEDDESDDDEMKDDSRPKTVSKAAASTTKQESLQPSLPINAQLRYMVSGMFLPTVATGSSR